MKAWVSVEAAARSLSVSPGQVEDFVAAGYVAGSRDQVSSKSVRGLHKLLLVLEAGLLGLMYYDEPPEWLTPELAAVWLDVPEEEIRAMAEAGLIETATWDELETEDALEVLFALEATTPKEEWTDAAALIVDSLEFKVRGSGYVLQEHDLRSAEQLTGTTFVCAASSIRSVARERFRFNPPRAIQRRSFSAW